MQHSLFNNAFTELWSSNWSVLKKVQQLSYLASQMIITKCSNIMNYISMTTSTILEVKNKIVHYHEQKRQAGHIWLTFLIASPFPWFLPRIKTLTFSILYFLTKSKATFDVRSLLPSSTINTCEEADSRKQNRWTHHPFSEKPFKWLMRSEEWLKVIGWCIRQPRNRRYRYYHRYSTLIMRSWVITLALHFMQHMPSQGTKK